MAEHDLSEMVGYLGNAVGEIDRLNAENKRLRSVLSSAASKLQRGKPRMGIEEEILEALKTK